MKENNILPEKFQREKKKKRKLEKYLLIGVGFRIMPDSIAEVITFRKIAII